MVAVCWSNGKIDRARDWDALLEKVRRSQYRTLEPAAFREELAKRAYVWSGIVIDHTLPAQELFRDLSWAKVVQIIDYGKDT